MTKQAAVLLSVTAAAVGAALIVTKVIKRRKASDCSNLKTDKDSSGLLILIRHGQSVWNRRPDDPNRLWRYAGSIDVPLSEVGIQEALEVGEKLCETPIDIVFSSDMDRAKSTVSLAMSVHSSGRTPIIQHSCPLTEATFAGVNDADPSEFILPMFISPLLKERNFGKFQGVPSTKHTEAFTADEIRMIRNDFYTKFPGKNGESSSEVYDRVVPYFLEYIKPHLDAGRNVLVSSHGFAIRTLIKYLDEMSDEEWHTQMNIEKSNPSQCHLLAPTGVPLTYRCKNGQFLKRRMSKIDRSESLSRTSAAY